MAEVFTDADQGQIITHLQGVRKAERSRVSRSRGLLKSFGLVVRNSSVPSFR